jgi:hypothetical protein
MDATGDDGEAIPVAASAKEETVVETAAHPERRQVSSGAPSHVS